MSVYPEEFLNSVAEKLAERNSEPLAMHVPTAVARVARAIHDAGYIILTEPHVSITLDSEIEPHEIEKEAALMLTGLPS